MTSRRKVLAVIFDLDGTVLDNEDIYGEAFREVLGLLGKKVAKKRPQEGGIGLEANWSKLLKEHHIKTDKTVEQLALMTQEAYIKRMGEVSVREGFSELVDDLKARGILVALATSNHWGAVDKVFEKFGLNGVFDMVTTVEEVDAPKPDPAIFLVTAWKLGVEPEDCLVIEDAVSGILAARAAGMKAISVGAKFSSGRSLSL